MAMKTTLAVFLIVMMFLLIGCNTAEGFVEDVRFIGNKTAEIIDR